MISKEVLDADLVINLPKLKTHSLSYITGSVKNTFGYIVGGDKLNVHALAPTQRKFSEALVDVYQIRPPDLTLMDAVVAMEGNGPSNGTKRVIGKILAGRNAVTLDAVALHLLGHAVKDVRHLVIAGRRGLGEVDLSQIEISGDFKPVTDFKFPATFISGISGVVFNRLMSRWIHRPPEVIPSRCQVCGVCIDHCPAAAMVMTEDSPRVDSDTCIKCYCCQEMCPADALRISGRFNRFIR
jgi:ferredoxin